ncbi:PREDICTED: transcription factor ORG2-like isoform X2 [Populus euphratica]|uniref:Transcription factor ORG2-like isoform X2 n=1 Tax=Populus euphratica TaxID=75702 RepID=A0AAJ6V557_POPEU|nr:PREDICTED: transcription factor ORG2-like isoform X2 [Populus euphratica]
MLELSPTTLFSTFGWPVEEPTSHEGNYLSFRDSETPESLITQFPPSQPQIIKLDRSPSFTAYSGSVGPSMVKKLSHNANERDRRKKIKSLYSSLRSLLPAADQMKLSVPATVSRALKYLPELQQQVERLVQRKEELLSKQGGIIHQENQRNGTVYSSLSSVSASQLSDKEVVVHISTYKNHKSPLSEILLTLEEDRLVLKNSSSFESSGDRVFYNLHLQVMEGTYTLDSEAMRAKLVSLYVKRESSSL